jgi:hypothetical protein
MQSIFFGAFRGFDGLLGFGAWFHFWIAHYFLWSIMFSIEDVGPLFSEKNQTAAGLHTLFTRHVNNKLSWNTMTPCEI